MSHAATVRRLEEATKLARSCGFRAPFLELPQATRLAFLSPDDVRISQRSDRKSFGRSKSVYGHFCGHAFKGMGARDLRERAEIASHL